MIGYESIPIKAPLTPAAEPPARLERNFNLDLRRLVAAQGFTEVMNHSFVSEEILRELDLSPDDHLKVLNPIAAGQERMRASLIPGIIRNIRENSRYLSQFRLFEIGFQIHRLGPPPPPGKKTELPIEVPHLVAAVYSRKGDGSAGLFEIKHLAECIMPGIELMEAEPRSYEHPHRTFEVDWRGDPVGYILELHPRIVDGRAALLDLDLQALHLLGPLKKKYSPLHRYPGSEFDLSVVAGVRELAGDIERRLKELTGGNLDSIEYLRRYTGSQLPEGKQSLSYRLKVFAADHTLTAEEVAAIRDRIIEGMKIDGYELRV
jgi:phenylalanyl-tRNA synthetase beta chain